MSRTHGVQAMTGTKIRTTFPVKRRGKPKGRGQQPKKTSAQPPTRAARMLALAHHIERRIDAGAIPDYATAARSLGVTRARLTQLMNLLLLAPEIQERIATGAVIIGERALRLAVGEPAWVTQLAAVEETVGKTDL